MNRHSQQGPDIRNHVTDDPIDFSGKVGLLTFRDKTIYSPFGDTLVYKGMGVLITGEAGGAGKTTVGRALAEMEPETSYFVRENTPTMAITREHLLLCASGDLENQDLVQGFQEIADGTASLVPVSVIFEFLWDTSLVPDDQIREIGHAGKIQCLSEGQTTDPALNRRLADLLSGALTDVPLYRVGDFTRIQEKIEAVAEILDRHKP